MPTVCLNGRFLEATEAAVPVDDRSFLYGDALFETLRVYGGVPFSWNRHMDRLKAGASLLDMELPSDVLLLAQAEALIRRNRAWESVLRIHVSRGSGPRGYLPDAASPPRYLLTTGAVPELGPLGGRPIAVVTSRFRVSSGEQWARCKSANRLVQVMASAEARRKGVDETLVLNERSEVVEATSANFFWVEDDVIRTPRLDSGALAGVTRAWVLELARVLKMDAREGVLAMNDLPYVDAAFLTSSVCELRIVERVDDRRLSGAPVIRELHRIYRQRVEEVCGVCRDGGAGFKAK